MSHLRRALVACPVLLLAACSGDDESDDTLAPLPTGTVVSGTTAPSTATSIPPTSTTVVLTTVAPTTAPPTTAAPTTAAPTTAPPTTPAPTTAPPPPPTTAPPAQGIVLGADGAGVTAFGDDPDAAIASVTAVLGNPTEDSGWVEPFTISACPGTEYRRVRWGSFSLQFSDQSSRVEGRRHVFGYEYGEVGRTDAEPAGLATSEGIGIGSTVAELKAAYPGVSVVAGEEGLSSSSFEVSENGLAGLLTDATDNGIVIVVVGGDFCGG